MQHLKDARGRLLEEIRLYRSSGRAYLAKEVRGELAPLRRAIVWLAQRQRLAAG